MRTPVAFALLFAFLADAAPGRSPAGPPPPSPEEQIRIRQGGELFMSWNMNRIREMVAPRSKTYDRVQVLSAAQGIAAVANAGLSALYGPGTDKPVGEIKTRVKQEFFQQPEKVRALMGDFALEANRLVKVAETGDPAAIRQQLALTGEACKSCHEAFRVKE